MYLADINRHDIHKGLFENLESEKGNEKFVRAYDSSRIYFIENNRRIKKTEGKSPSVIKEGERKMKNVKIEELVKNHSRTKDGIHLGSEDMVISILQKNIVEVRLTCGKGSLKTSLSPKALGVDISKKKDDTKEFFNDFVADGAIWHFPKPLKD